MDWEFVLLNNIQRGRNDFLDKLMPCISFLGKWALLWVVITVICITVRKYRRLGLSLICNIIVNFITCNLVLKPIVERLRPYVLNTTVNLIVPPETEFSFPSGHTFFAFGAATIIFMYNKTIGVVLYVVAILIAFSRLYLYVHFPTDVLFGIVFGIILALISYKMDRIIFDTPKIKKIRFIKAN